jgi:hypothetical protein
MNAEEARRRVRQVFSGQDQVEGGLTGETSAVQATHRRTTTSGGRRPE